MKNARYYFTARTTHLARLADFAPGWLLYTKTRSDFDPGAAPDGAMLERVSLPQLIKFLFVHELDNLELPEPLAVRAWPQVVGCIAAVRIRNIFTGSHTRLVTYALENYPVDSKLSEFGPIPLSVSRNVVNLVGSWISRRMDMVVFGTEASRELYRSQVSDRKIDDPTASPTIWGLPSPDPELLMLRDPDAILDSSPTLVFLGSFEERKGIRQVLDAWASVRAAIPNARLIIMGKGPLEDFVISRSATEAGVEVLIDPPRRKIFETLRTAKAVVLFSQPAPGWKEQIGLPIVEGLGCGCEIVSSDETGISGWLRANGHQVVSAAAGPFDLGDACVRALTSRRSKGSILQSLPQVDGRLAADTWMFGDKAISEPADA